MKFSLSRRKKILLRLLIADSGRVQGILFGPVSMGLKYIKKKKKNREPKFFHGYFSTPSVLVIHLLIQESYAAKVRAH